MKVNYHLTIRKNSSWLMSVAFGFLGALVSAILLPMAMIMLIIFVPLFIIAGFLGLVDVKEENSETT